MPYIFADTRDQAVLAYVIKVAAEIACKKKAYVGRTAVQKIMYFLKILGVPVNYRFDLHHYGPFCTDILSDVDILLGDDIIEDNSSNRNKYSNYITGENCDSFIEEYRDFIEDNKATISDVTSALITLKTEELEIIATLVYVYRWLKASSDSSSKDAVVSKFMEIKKDKYSLQVVEKYYDMLVEIKLID